MTCPKHTCQTNDFENYIFNHRGYITREMLTLEQVRELWEFYRKIAQRIIKEKNDMERLRLGNAFRSFMMAVVYNTTVAIAEIMEETT